MSELPEVNRKLSKLKEPQLDALGVFLNIYLGGKRNEKLHTLCEYTKANWATLSNEFFSLLEAMTEDTNPKSSRTSSPLELRNIAKDFDPFPVNVTREPTKLPPGNFIPTRSLSPLRAPSPSRYWNIPPQENIQYPIPDQNVRRDYVPPNVRDNVKENTWRDFIRPNQGDPSNDDQESLQWDNYQSPRYQPSPPPTGLRDDRPTPGKAPLQMTVDELAEVLCRTMAKQIPSTPSGGAENRGAQAKHQFGSRYSAYQREVERRKLKCSGDDRPKSFIDEIDALKETFELSTQEVLQSMSSILIDSAARWFAVARSTIKTWGDFKAEFYRNYIAPDRDHHWRRLMLQRSMDEGERGVDYLHALQLLMREMKRPMEEAELVSLAVHQLHPDYPHALELRRCRTMEELTTMCIEVDQLQAGKRGYAPPPRNLTTDETFGNLTRIPKRQVVAIDTTGAGNNIPPVDPVVQNRPAPPQNGCVICHADNHNARGCNARNGVVCFRCGTPNETVASCKNCRQYPAQGNGFQGRNHQQPRPRR